MENSVRLDRLPDGLRFPEDLKDRISYDASRQQLVFRGFMSKVTFDRLERLSADLDYQRGIEALFIHSSDHERPDSNNRNVAVMILVVVLAIALCAMLLGWLST